MSGLALPVIRSHKHKLMFIILTIILTAAVSGAAYYLTNRDAGATLDGFKAGNIMDDAVMSNKGAMSESQIQSFLKSKADSCTSKGPYSNGSYYYDKLSKSGDGKTAYDGSYVWNIKNGHFVCMADDKFGGETAAHIIWQAAQDYNVNPQVLIVLLQKEQGLVTDGFPNNHQYLAATGYDCPDNGNGCNNANAGFKTQIRKAAALFHEVLTGGWTNYPVGSNFVKYNPSDSCGGTVINIANRATSALYRYTPYQPNKAALDAGYGSGNSCSAYGNRNFYNYFTDWFGSTIYKLGGAIGAKYNSLGGSHGVLGMPQSNEITLSTGGVYQQFENGQIYWKTQKGAWVIAYGTGNKYIDAGADKSILGYPLGDEKTLATGGVYQQFEHGRIYWKSTKGTWIVAGGIGDKYITLGADGSTLGYPLSDEIVSSAGGVYQQYENGRIYWKSGLGGAWTVSGNMLTYYLSNDGDGGSFGYPISDVKSSGSDTYQNFEHAIVYRTSSQTYVTHGAVGDKYRSASDITGALGVPQGNEVSLATGGVYQQFANGRIYWKSKKGAWVVSGNILSYYLTKSADAGPLGYPVSDSTNLSGGNTYQNFEGGAIYKVSTNQYSTQGAVGDRYNSVGGPTGYLGVPLSNENTLGTGGVYQQFTNGRVYWKSGKGAWIVAGGIGTKYIALGADGSALGYPLSNEIALSTGGVYQQFENGRIYWKSQKGAWMVAYGTGNKYVEVGADKSILGYPLSDETALSTGGVYQQFERGRIYWKSTKGTWIVAGGIGDKYISLGADGSTLGYPLSDEIATSNGRVYQKYEHGKIYWTPSIGASVVM